MLSSYVTAHSQFPDIVVSLLEQSSGLIHSCHFILHVAAPTIRMTSLMLLTYTECGIRLSCSEFENLELLSSDTGREKRDGRLVEEHFKVGYLSCSVKS